jgi:hypothetical protein
MTERKLAVNKRSRQLAHTPLPYERAAEIALAHPDAALMQGMEEPSFRQIWRITNLLLRINRQAREGEPIEIPRRKPVCSLKHSTLAKN